MKILFTITLILVSCAIFANEQLLISLKSVEYAKTLASKGLGEFSLNELKMAKNTLMAIDDKELTEYQQNMKLSMINEIIELENDDYETLSKCEYLYKKIDIVVEESITKSDVIQNWKTLNMIEDKIKGNPDCKMLKIVKEKIQNNSKKA